MESVPANSFYEQLETGNMEYFRYKYGLKGIRFPEGRKKKDDPQRAAALERGRMLCFQAEIEQMEREELGMSVTKLTLPEEFYMEIREDGPGGVFPLYVGAKAEKSEISLFGKIRKLCEFPLKSHNS